MVSTQLKNISENGSFPQVGVNIKNIWNHHPDHYKDPFFPNQYFMESNVRGFLTVTSFRKSAKLVAPFWVSRLMGWRRKPMASWQEWIQRQRTPSTRRFGWNHFLVGGWTNPSEEYSSNWKSPANRGENKTYLKPPPSFVGKTVGFFQTSSYWLVKVPGSENSMVYYNNPHVTV